jgi:hypothetical protein
MALVAVGEFQINASELENVLIAHPIIPASPQ